MSRKDLNTASEKIKEMTMDTFTILTVAVLHDELDSVRNAARGLLTG